MPGRSVKTTCPYCGVGCGIRAERTGATVTVTGDESHPANAGKLCSKGSALAETLGMDGRLLHPIVDGARADWSTALDLVARRFTETIKAHGPESVAFYVSGQLLTEDYYVANKLMKGFIGGANIDTNSRLCMASSVSGHRRAFGEDVVPGCYDDLEESDLVVLVGSNLAWCHPVLYQRLMKARATRGTRVVTIDPRRTASCDGADLHLPIRPGTDVLLFNGLLAEIVRNGAFDPGFIARHCEDFDDAATVALASAPSVESVAGVCDVLPGDLATFYGWFVRTERCVTVYSQGVNQSSAGTDKVNAIINCHLATGRIGKPGMGPFSVTGQPNAMGGREVGGLANQLAAHMVFEEPADVDRVARFWGTPNVARSQGLKAVDMFRAVEEGRIKAIWIMATNPAVSLPDGNAVRRGLAGCPFVVVSDCESDTDTTRLAHVLLPAAAWGEKDGTVTNSERCISRQRPFLRLPGEARPDWWIVSQSARRMGFAEAFPYESPADVFREHAALSAFENDGTRAFDIGAMAEIEDDAYAALDPFQWPRARGATASRARLFGDGQFFTKSRRAVFIPTELRAPAFASETAYPLILNTGRVRDQWHTMTRTGKSPRLARHTPEPFIDVHPTDARRLGVSDGGLARVATRWGEALLRARVSHEQRPGEVFVPMHWSDVNAADAAVGRLVNPVTDPVSGQPELKSTPARIEPFAAVWRGYLIARDRTIPQNVSYWVHVAVTGGSVVELAGESLPDANGIWARQLMGAQDGDDIVEFTDPGRGIGRWARISGDRLEACLFLAPDGSREALPPQSWLIGLLANETLSVEARHALLMGRPSSGAADTGRIVCSCFGVGVNALREAIASGVATTVEEIGRRLRAGTNCGSCVAELRGLLSAPTPALAAESDAA